MRVCHVWQRLPTTAILLVLVGAVATPRLARCRMHNAGRTGPARALRLDEPRRNVTLRATELPVRVNGCQPPNDTSERDLLALGTENAPHVIAGVSHVSSHAECLEMRPVLPGPSVLLLVLLTVLTL